MRYVQIGQADRDAAMGQVFGLCSGKNAQAARNKECIQ
jgi:hypothetical protein